MAPEGLAPPLQSLPPILHKSFPSSLPSCSKGARGLSVLPRVDGIFTAISISLRITLRQRPDRYAIRAGRNFMFHPLFPAAQTMPSSCFHDLPSAWDRSRQEPAYCIIHRFVAFYATGERCLTFRFSRYGVILVAEQRTSHDIAHC